MLSIKWIVTLCIALGLYIHEMSIKKVLYFLTLLWLCNIGLWFCNIAYELLTNKAVVYTTVSYNTNASPICIIDDSNEVEIGHIANKRISDTHQCDRDIKGLYVHHAKCSDVQLAYKQIQNVEFAYVDSSTDIELTCQSTQDVRFSHIKNSTLLIKCCNDERKPKIDLSYIEDSTITLIFCGSNEFPINISHAKNVTIITNSNDIEQTYTDNVTIKQPSSYALS